MRTKTNTGRQIELDIAKGFSVIFMVFSHVMLQFSSERVSDSLYSSIVDFFAGIPAAPVFMFMLGVGVIYSKKATAKTLAYRGVQVLCAGYILNFFRSVLPVYINHLQGYTEYTSIFELFYDNFFYVDILQFAGLAMLFLALVLKFKLSHLNIICITLVFMGLNLILLPHMPRIENIWSTPLLSLVIGGAETSYFPFLTWIVYPVSGYIFGSYLIQATDKRQFYAQLFKVTGPVLLLYLVGILMMNFPTGYENEALYYQHTALINIIYILFVLWWLSFVYFISQTFHLDKIAFIQTLSKNTNKIYYIHFILIGVLLVYIHIRLEVLPIFILSLVITLLSYFLSKKLPLNWLP
ncbi:heparan-alpha-glucosaminide N-acetyltransferase domain-containing protein [Lactococcus garvieae]|uniref:heparan-alpha-glucosaminide N-acetyltransferase domain-containing protein n=1 Tax=Lactococcus garvieae TaxID=1363 RepID=UPI0030CC205D